MRRIALVVAEGLALQLAPAAPTALGACSTAWTPSRTRGAGRSTWRSSTPAPRGTPPRMSLTRAVVSRWDGVEAWTQVPLPRAKDQDWELIEGVDASAEDDVWLAGHYFSQLAQEHFAYLAHWDGLAFERFPVDSSVRLRSCTRSRSSVPTTRGRSAATIQSTTRSLAVHWDGTAWTRVTTPTPPAARELYDVAISSRDVWSIGSSYDNGVTRPFTLHWNGFGWR